MRAWPSFSQMMATVIIVLALTQFPSSVCASDAVGAIYDAIRHEDVAKVRVSLAEGTNVVNQFLEKRFTLLHFAAEHGSIKGTEILKLLLADGADVGAKNHIGQTPLFSAVIYGNPAATKILIAHGAKVNVRQLDGRTPLHWAALNGDCDIARVLIENKAALHVKNSDGKTPAALALEEQQRATKDGNLSLIRRYQEMTTLLSERDATR